MRAGSIILTLGPESGVNPIYHLGLEKEDPYILTVGPGYFIDLLSKEFTRLGYQLVIDGVTSSASKDSGSSPV